MSLVPYNVTEDTDDDEISNVATSDITNNGSNNDNISNNDHNRSISIKYNNNNNNNSNLKPDPVKFDDDANQFEENHSTDSPAVEHTGESDDPELVRLYQTRAQLQQLLAELWQKQNGPSSSAPPSPSLLSSPPPPSPSPPPQSPSPSPPPSPSPRCDDVLHEAEADAKQWCDEALQDAEGNAEQPSPSPPPATTVPQIYVRRDLFEVASDDVDESNDPFSYLDAGYRIRRRIPLSDPISDHTHDDWNRSSRSPSRSSRPRSSRSRSSRSRSSRPRSSRPRSSRSRSRSRRRSRSRSRRRSRSRSCEHRRCQNGTSNGSSTGSNSNRNSQIRGRRRNGRPPASRPASRPSHHSSCNQRFKVGGGVFLPATAPTHPTMSALFVDRARLEIERRLTAQAPLPLAEGKQQLSRYRETCVVRLEQMIQWLHCRRKPAFTVPPLNEALPGWAVPPPIAPGRTLPELVRLNQLCHGAPEWRWLTVYNPTVERTEQVPFRVVYFPYANVVLYSWLGFTNVVLYLFAQAIQRSFSSDLPHQHAYSVGVLARLLDFLINDAQPVALCELRTTLVADYNTAALSTGRFPPATSNLHELLFDSRLVPHLTAAVTALCRYDVKYNRAPPHANWRTYCGPHNSYVQVFAAHNQPRWYSFPTLNAHLWLPWQMPTRPVSELVGEPCKDGTPVVSESTVRDFYRYRPRTVCSPVGESFLDELNQTVDWVAAQVTTLPPPPKPAPLSARQKNMLLRIDYGTATLLLDTMSRRIITRNVQRAAI